MKKERNNNKIKNTTDFDVKNKNWNIITEKVRKQ